MYKNYSELSAHRNIAEIPIIAVGTQGKSYTCFVYRYVLLSNMMLCANSLSAFLSADKISSTNARVIEDKRVQQLCIDVRRCTYFETCATYGLNVDRVFSESELDLKIGVKIAGYFEQDASVN